MTADSATDGWETSALSTSAVPMRTASLKLSGGSLVLDYTTMATSATNYVFRGDMTYYISGTVNLYGTNTWEGNSVIKFASGTSINLVSCNIYYFAY